MTREPYLLVQRQSLDRLGERRLRVAVAERPLRQLRVAKEYYYTVSLQFSPRPLHLAASSTEYLWYILSVGMPHHDFASTSAAKLGREVVYWNLTSLGRSARVFKPRRGLVVWCCV